jgi:ComF family protein
MKNKLLNFCSDILYPRFCYGCGRYGEFLCEKCYSKIDFTPNLPLLKNSPPTLLRPDQTHLDSVQAVCRYDSPITTMIKNFKYFGVKDLAQTFGYWLYQYLALPPADIITYVPLHSRRLQERGYNQAALIAQNLSSWLNLPCLPLLQRPLYQEKQSLSHNKNQRFRQVVNVFAPLTPAYFPPKVLLIDDVITTGVTLNQAAKVLKENGCRQVYGVAVTHGY